MHTLDGSRGEGGGQILRSALSLALVTGQPFRIHSIRAGREKPGLKRQHLASVLAAQRIGAARVSGATLGSSELVFEPGAIQPGTHRFAVGSAGSASLVLQTILPALWSANAPSTVEIEGGTHNPLAPPADFVRDVFLPVLERMGPRVELEIVRYGFFPAGGGLLRATITPAPLRPIELTERGEPTLQRVRCLVANLPPVVAARELATVRREFGWGPGQLEEARVAGPGPGNVLSIELGFEHVRELVSAFGERDRASEFVAKEACAAARTYLEHEAPVGEHLADQLVLPFALAGGGRFRALPLSPHATTNIELVREWLGRRIDVVSDERNATVSFA